ncbi:hypothetical protein CsSME_00007244 [Camellia sinensis var. sinensis]
MEEAVVVFGACGYGVEVCQVLEEGWVKFVDSCLVGRVGTLGVGISDMENQGGLQVKAVGNQFMLFAFPTKADAE